jgi:hypothetical protein
MVPMNGSFPDPEKDCDHEKRGALVRALIEAEQGGISLRSVQRIIADTKTNLKNDEL